MSEQDETEYPAELGEPMRVVWMRVEKIKRYGNNPRRNAKAVKKVRASLDAFGWRQPIVVDSALVIIVGDTRYLAAVERGDPAVPVHIAADMDPAQAKAYRLADNRIHEEADWDDERLDAELRELAALDVDMSETGFDADELRDRLEDDDAPELTPVEVTPLPTMTWLLVGIPTTRFVEIAEEVERISLVEDIFCEMVSNNDAASAHRKSVRAHEGDT